MISLKQIKLTVQTKYYTIRKTICYFVHYSFTTNRQFRSGACRQQRSQENLETHADKTCKSSEQVKPSTIYINDCDENCAEYQELGIISQQTQYNQLQ